MSGAHNCKTCAHPKRDQIEQAMVAGWNNGRISREFGVSVYSLNRHRHNHLTPAIRKALETRNERAGDAAADRLEELYRKGRRLLEKADKQDNIGHALAAIRELRGIVELLARMTGELDERPQVNVVSLAASPEWQATLQRIVTALHPYPDASQAVAQALGMMAPTPALTDVVDAELIEDETAAALAELGLT